GASLRHAQASGQIIEHATLFLPVKGRLGDVAVNPASTLAFVANIDKNEIEVVDLLTHTLQRPIPVGFEPYGVDLTPDGKTLYVANIGEKDISVVDVIQRKQVDTIATLTALNRSEERRVGKDGRAGREGK